MVLMAGVSSLQDQSSGANSCSQERGHDPRNDRRAGATVLISMARVVASRRRWVGSRTSRRFVARVAEGCKLGVVAHGVERWALRHVWHVQAQSLPCLDFVTVAVTGGIRCGADLAVRHGRHLLANGIDGSCNKLARGKAREGRLRLAGGNQRAGGAEDRVGLGADSTCYCSILCSFAKGCQDCQGRTVGGIQLGVRRACGVERASGQVGRGLADVVDGGVDVVVGDGKVGARGIRRGGQADGIVRTIMGRNRGHQSRGDSKEQ